MVNNPPDNPELKLSLQRRFAALRPYAERALSHAAPPPSEATIKQYRAAVDRMEARRLWPEEIGANCRPSFYLYRAGLVYVTRDRLREAADRFAVEATKMNARQAHELLNEIDDCLAVLERYPPGALDEKSRWRRSTAVQVRKSKRRGLGLLPTRWREIMLGACPPNSSYQNAMLVLALTGLRPVELAMGVRVQAIGGGMRITIRGAKVTEQAGQPPRQILFKPEVPRDNQDENRARCLTKSVPHC
jgi:hypothetical protein